MTSYLTIEQAAHEGAYGHNALAHPSPAMQDAGNYKKGRTSVRGFPVVIENPRGTLRQWRAADGTSGANLMRFHYGYFQGVKGADGDELDVYLGPAPESNTAFVVNQFLRGAFDEHKVMLGFPDQRTAEAGYLSNFDSGWQGMNSCVPCSLAQLKWWMTYGDMSKPLTPDQLPYEERNDMQKVIWDSANAPVGTTLAQLLYRIRAHDGRDSLMFDPLTAADILADSDGVLALDALVVPYARLEPRMAILKKVMDRAVEGLSVASFQITEPFSQKGTTNVAAVFELSDGQTLSIFFHNPDVTPKKIMPGDDLISWKWMLNKKDVTIAVAPERGRDLNVRNVALRVMSLAAKNSSRFASTNAKRAERMASIDGLQKEFAEKEATLETLTTEIQQLEAIVAAKPTAAPEPAAAPVEPVEPAAVVETQPKPVIDPETPVAPAIDPEAPAEPEAPAVVAQEAPAANPVVTEQESAELEARAAALRPQIEALSDSELAMMAATAPLSIGGFDDLVTGKDATGDKRARLIDHIMASHPDDIEASLTRWRENYAPAASSKPDLTYRKVDDMFTMFYPETPAGETAWNQMAEHTDGTGKVLHAQVESTIQQLREAGYTVEPAVAPDQGIDDVLAELDALDTPGTPAAPKPQGEPALEAAGFKNITSNVWARSMTADDGRFVRVNINVAEGGYFVRKSIGAPGITGAGQDLGQFDTAEAAIAAAQAEFDAFTSAPIEPTYPGADVLEANGFRHGADNVWTRSESNADGVRLALSAYIQTDGTYALRKAIIGLTEAGAVEDVGTYATPGELVDAAVEEITAFLSPTVAPTPEPETPATNPDAVYMQSIIDGSADLSDAAIPARLMQIHADNAENADMQALFKQAVNAYSAFAVAKARAKLAA
ncbi:hypothetical protein LA345_39065 (plasmid) [Burkholderia vietnamiensis]|uniref:Defence against restriction A N-terminal domain-containing protein n=1 Tax=Burkholderia vietnamiensis (strain G4 / LMG 22486) TaxID=269482 RepID=A4JWH2_BURVG|nr:hypothetical protein Bcep1808_7755 [Burkholderia vietnamiensis G4]MCB4349801.1 hypothetical protein [Burkholderia vietnamiensis]